MRNAILALIVLISFGSIAYAAAPFIFTSGQEGASPTKGYVLQTDGLNSTWVATSTLGISGGGGGSGTVTNIATTYPILGGPITTTATLSLAFGTTTANIWSMLQQFNGNASTTQLSILNNLYLSSITGTQCLHSIGGVVSGTGSDCGSGGGATYPFTPSTNFGAAASATSTALWAQGQLQASSTVQVGADIDLYGNRTITAPIWGDSLTISTKGDELDSGMSSGNISILGGSNGSGGHTAGTVTIEGGEWAGGGTGAGDAVVQGGNGSVALGGNAVVAGGVGTSNIYSGNVIFKINGSEVARFLGSVSSGLGNFGIGTTTPSSLLSIGNTNGINFSTGTSTFSSTGGINLVSGCYALAGVCVGNNLGTVTSVTGTYPVISSGGTTPAISLAFGTTTSNTWAGTQMFTNQLTATGGITSNAQLNLIYSGPAMLFSNTGAATDNKNWVLGAGATSLTGFVLNDSGSTQTNWLNVNRSGTTISSIVLSTGASTGTAGLTIDANQKTTLVNASTTALSATTLCLSTDCRTAWPTSTTYTGTYPISVTGSVISTVATSSLGLTTASFASPNISQWTNNSGYLTANQSITLSGDITGSGATSIATTLATVNSNVGTFTYPSITVNGKGLITAASSLTPVTSIKQTFGTAQTGAITLATTSASFNGLTVADAITNSSGTFTIAPQWSGTLNNSGLTNNSLTVNTASPLGGGGSVSLGGTLNLTCSTCLTSAPVSSVANSDGSLTISPTTGVVVASLALGNPNTWTGLQQFNGNASTTAITVAGNFYIYAGTVPTFASNVSSIRIGSTGNLVLNAGGTKTVIVDADTGTGGFEVEDGTATGNVVASIDGSGNTALDGTITLTGLGATSATGDYLCFNTTSNLVRRSTATCTLSTEKVKNSIAPLTASDGLTAIMELQPVSFLYDQGFGDNGSTTQIGLIAEQTAKVNPLFAEYADSPFSTPNGEVKVGDPDGINWNGLEAPIILAIQQQQAEIEALKAPAVVVAHDAEDKWQWLAIGFLFGMIIWDRRKIRALERK